MNEIADADSCFSFEIKWEWMTKLLILYSFLFALSSSSPSSSSSISSLSRMDFKNHCYFLGLWDCFDYLRAPPAEFIYLCVKSWVPQLCVPIIFLFQWLYTYLSYSYSTSLGYYYDYHHHHHHQRIFVYIYVYISFSVFNLCAILLSHFGVESHSQCHFYSNFTECIFYQQKKR